ncbi:MAG: hypothetical protein K2I25_08625, partial [Muribaculaceae bacterium]|nr:hypothetical protein [Muribaculaceae bacterium]
IMQGLFIWISIQGLTDAKIDCDRVKNNIKYIIISKKKSICNKFCKNNHGKSISYCSCNAVWAVPLQVTSK